MGTQQNTIVILGIVAAIIVVLFIAFRNFKFADALGLPNVQEEIDKVTKTVSDTFGSFVDALSAPFQEKHDPNRLSGTTIDASDQFGEGAEITFSEGTTIDKEGKIDAPQGVELKLADDDEALLLGFFAQQDILRANAERNIARAGLSEDEIFKINKLATDFVRLNVEQGVPRDSTGLVQLAFTAPAIQARAVNVELNTRKANTTLFGGFDSALAQEQALRDAIAASRAAHPELFQQFDAQSQAALIELGKKKR